MAEELLNGREPLPQEMAALERGRRQDRERARALLAGVLAEDREPEPAGRPVTTLPGLS